MSLEKNTNSLQGIFSADAKIYSSKSEETSVDEEQFYAVASKDQSLKKFQLILRSGEKYRIPYAILPITLLSDRCDELSMMAYGLLITIKGRNLEPIEHYLAEETLLWAREAPSSKDDGLENLFISNIGIKGKAISTQVE